MEIILIKFQKKSWDNDFPFHLVKRIARNRFPAIVPQTKNELLIFGEQSQIHWGRTWKRRNLKILMALGKQRILSQQAWGRTLIYFSTNDARQISAKLGQSFPTIFNQIVKCTIKLKIVLKTLKTNAKTCWNLKPCFLCTPHNLCVQPKTFLLNSLTRMPIWRFFEIPMKNP